jgi:hypothetical protein
MMVVIRGGLNAEGAVDASGNSTRHPADSRAYDRADRSGGPSARVSSDRCSLLGAASDALSLRRQGQGQERQPGSQCQESCGHGSLLRWIMMSFNPHETTGFRPIYRRTDVSGRIRGGESI